ncbi:MAG: hypothetical protein BGO87_08950 [Flavobacteriia bacterium 40-80]|nr:MAG: hypothetical protein BGO87_08950 [Flavobacteriia bacterium 40-80]
MGKKADELISEYLRSTDHRQSTVHSPDYNRKPTFRPLFFPDLSVCITVKLKRHSLLSASLNL